MRLWPFRKKALTADAGALDAVRDRSWQPYPLLGGGGRQRIVDAYNTAQSANYAWMYTNSPAVRTVVDVIARNVGQLDLRLYEEIDAAERRPKPDHPAALSLRYPNEDTASDSFVRSLFVDYLIYKNAYALILQAPQRQLSFEHLPASAIEIRGNSLFRAEGYRYWRRDGTWIDFTPDQILHWRGENPHDPRLGLSPLDTLRPVIAEDAALQQATVELANAGLTEPAWVFRPLEAPEWSNPARQAFEEDLTNRMRRRNKMPVVLEEGMEMRSFGVSPKDAEVMAVRRWAIERVAALYGVPLGMVGLANNLAEAQSQFYADTLPPYCEEFTKMLNQRVLVRVYNWTDGYFEFNLDEKHMGDDRLKTLVSATGRPVMTSNEARARLNLPKVDDGDDLVTPLNVTTGDNPLPSTDVMPIQDPNKPPQDGSYREESQKSLQAPLDPMAEEVRGVLEKLYMRQERAARNSKHFTEERFTRELAMDLMTIAPAVDREALVAVVGGVHEALDRSLRDALDPADVFELAHRNAGRLAKMIVTTLGMDPLELRSLGAPDEFVWERAGLLPQHIDRMRVMQLSERLLDAGIRE